MPKYALYARVSTNDQTCENQILQLIEYAKRQNWSYQIFEEKESSRNTRPIKEFLKKQLRKKAFDGLLVWKLDRWGRSTRELVTELDEFIHRGINFVSYQDNIDLSTPQGKFMAQILSAFAEFERDMISDRTKAGLERAKSQGKKLGRPPGSKDKKVRRKSGYYLRWTDSKKTPPVKTKEII